MIHNTDPRSALFEDAIQTELNGLQKRGVFKETRRSEFTDNELKDLTVIGSRLVLTIKGADTPNQMYKARLVAQAVGSRDEDKRMLLTYSPTVHKSSIRTLFSLSASVGLPMYFRDISQAYVSTDSSLLRDVYIIPTKRLELGNDVLWKVCKPLYGLPESGLLWFET